MVSPLKSLIAAGTKLWLDSIDPDLVERNRRLGATGATSNPIIVGDIIKSGRVDDRLTQLLEQGLDDDDVAWQLTDYLVSNAQRQFLEVWQQTNGNDGYVSFELDPLLEDVELGPEHTQRVAQYITLGKRWAANHPNRMIKVPATPAGLDALEELVAADISVNVTLVFSERQYIAARDAVWRGAQRRESLKNFKSVYSIFVSRVDVYTQEHVPNLSPQAQGQVGIVNAKRIWAANQKFWADKNLPLQQEIIFASTGVKKPEDPQDKYVAAFAGSDIETNPPGTNDAVEKLGKEYTRQIDQLPPDAVLKEIDEKVNFQHLEETLMREGLRKFSDPQKALLALIKQKRQSLTAAQ